MSPPGDHPWRTLSPADVTPHMQMSRSGACFAAAAGTGTSPWRGPGDTECHFGPAEGAALGQRGMGTWGQLPPPPGNNGDLGTAATPPQETMGTWGQLLPPHNHAPGFPSGAGGDTHTHTWDIPRGLVPLSLADKQRAEPRRKRLLFVFFKFFLCFLFQKNPPPRNKTFLFGGRCVPPQLSRPCATHDIF